MSNYVDNDYVEVGYVVGDEVLAQGVHSLGFVVSSGKMSEDELKSSVLAELKEDAITLIYIPESSKIVLTTKKGHTEFLGGVDIDKILNNQKFIDKITELSTVNLSATIKDSAGVVMANATVTQTSARSFDVEVPQEMVGTSYTISLSEA